MSPKRHVLVVDDDPQIVQAVTMRIQAMGFDVLTAKDGEAALQQTAECAPDLVIADIRMPRIDGLEFLRRLKHSDTAKSTPVIMISASAVDQSRALDEGASYFIAKPYDSRTLVDAINALIDDPPFRVETMPPPKNS